MTSRQIWNHANEHRELLRSIYQAINKGGDINDGMNRLKKQIPCLFGIDADRPALVFQSTDDGLVAVQIAEHGDTFALALEANILLES